MTDKRAQAVSVANHYFALVDGMVPGFKDHLAETVVLKWFGNVVRGRENVVAFLMSNKKGSFHTFPDITAISNMSCKSEQSNRTIKRPLDQNANCETYTNNHLHEDHASHETEMSTTHKIVKDYNPKSNANVADIHEAVCNEYEFYSEKFIDELVKISENLDNVDINLEVNENKCSASAIAEMDDVGYDDLNDNNLYNLFEPEITSQPIVGKIQNINRIKLKEEMAPTVRAINREYGQGDGPVTAEANATKYLEANGEIKFIRICADSDSPFLYHWSRLWKKKMWKRQCTLQIAYSSLTDNDSSKVATKCYNNATQENAYHNTCVSNLSADICQNTNEMQESKLPSLEDAIKISGTLIQDVNHFGGYLQPLNFSEDREDFLKKFEAAIATDNSEVHFSAHYVNNKLIFNSTTKKPFNVMYQINKIVYEYPNAMRLAHKKRQMQDNTIAQVCD
ncbi:PREDICTED: uncharacterized protein LOC105562185 [Vollenhovia emeryi]|uniref:uncharacterized protein LOC105562185 n=1 Tax=Vollenhovia emeryi TaxID=411798 RepID=UPI0005F38BA7|nr:PREDICTED: uncharacterized protein LOC105562185 [Vollenhovia emeryi]XP_011868202.1 PREDICTED: uncharacterized protein LOC105562185 [Vollenhovia emeryi]